MNPKALVFFARGLHALMSSLKHIYGLRVILKLEPLPPYTAPLTPLSVNARASDSANPFIVIAVFLRFVNPDHLRRGPERQIDLLIRQQGQNARLP